MGTFTPQAAADVLAVLDNQPSGLSQVRNEIGWRMVLDKLAGFVEVG